MRIRPTDSKVGVEVSDVDVRTISDADFAKVYQAWLDRNVLIVTGQELTIPEFLAYSRRFGIVEPHPSKSTRHPDYPDITLLGINKFNADGGLNMAIYRRGAEGWHTDGAYDDEPFKATQLYGLAVPDRGGNTLFASGYAAYEAMPQRLKDRLEGVRGGFTYGGRRQSNALLNPEDRTQAPAMHPIIRVHPETKRKSMYFDPGKIVFIEGAEKQESDDLINELETYMVQPDAEYHHKWSVGDIVIWDNRCSYPKAAGDYPPDQDRIHWRVSIKAQPTVTRLGA